MNQEKKEFAINSIAKQWDANVNCRAAELEKGIDKSYYQLIIPTVSTLISRYGNIGSSVLDVGCGLGYLTNHLYEHGWDITGIDISRNSIDYASKRFKNVRFINGEFLDFCSKTTQFFDTVLAVMYFHNSFDLKNQLFAIRQILRKNGYLILLLPHPCFWYKRFAEITYFNPDDLQEKDYSVYFKIRDGKRHNSKITYYHRTLETYLNFFEQTSFKVIDTVEPKHLQSTETDILAFVTQSMNRPDGT